MGKKLIHVFKLWRSYQFWRFRFVLSENIIETATKIEDQDKNTVIEISRKQLLESTPELTPKTGLTVIDGEYCDITFQENQFQKLRKINAFRQTINKDSHINAFDERARSSQLLRETKQNQYELPL